MKHLVTIGLALCVAAWGQETRGKISGRVVDASGAVIPGVEARAVNTATNVAAAGTSNAQGSFEIPYLPPGVYTLSAELAGFKKYVRTGIEVQVDAEIRIDIALEPGLVTESVTVTSAAPMLDTSPSLGQVVDNKRITELPLPGGNALTLMQLTAGVTYFGVPNHPNLAPAVEVVSNIGVSGLRDHNSEYSLDGAPSMWGRNASFVPPADMVGEFKVETSRFDAAGRAPGGSINISLRSGTNMLHGALSEYHSDNKLNSIDFFQRRFLYDPSSGPVNDAKRKSVNPQFIINRFSATMGGPVVLPKVYNGRNRTFWIYGFEGLTRPSQERGSYYHTVPTASQRQGDFSDLLKLGAQFQVYDPFSTVPAANGRFSRQPLAGNLVPKSRMDPVAGGFLKYWPMPNLAGLADGENNYWDVLSSYNEYFSHTARVDHSFNERHRMFARYNQWHQLFDSGSVLPGIADGNHRNRYNRGFGLDDVYVITPEFLVNFRYSLTRFIQTTSPFGLGFDLVGAGFSKALVSQLDPRGITFPNINLDLYEVMGNAQPSGTFQIYHTWGLDFTRMRGNHSLRFGGEYRLYRAYNNPYNFQTPGIDVTSTWTKGPLDNSAGAPIGQDLASFLYGLPTGGKGQINASYAEQTTYTAAFLQDDFKVSPRLTLNAGLRYEFETAPTERYNRSVAGFDFKALNPIQSQVPADVKTLGGLTFAGVNGNSRSLWQTDKNNFAPRAGVALRLPHSSVLRAGYGLFYVTNGVDRLDVNQTGFTLTTTLVPSLDNGQTYVATVANPFPNGYQQPQGAAAGLATNLGRAVTFFNPARPHGFAQRWTAGLQKQLPGNVRLEAAYVGTAASRLDITRQWDPVPREYLSTSPVRDAAANNLLTAAVNNPFYPALVGTDIGGRTVARSQLLRPYPQFNGITSVGQDGYSMYHALQFRAERRLRGGFTLQGNYTWSKFMEATAYLNPTDARPERVISDQDRAQRFVASGIWELPFGRGRKFASSWHAAPRYAVSGWQMSAVYQGQSGAPLGFGNVLYYGDVHSIPLPIDQRAVDHWYDTSQFEGASGKQLVSNLRTFPTRMTGLRGPGVNIWNASILRVFRVSERVKLQFRSEWLNATNHSFLANPNMSPTSLAFGTITGTTGYPRQIYFGLKLMY